MAADIAKEDAGVAGSAATTAPGSASGDGDTTGSGGRGGGGGGGVVSGGNGGGVGGVGVGSASNPSFPAVRVPSAVVETNDTGGTVDAVARSAKSMAGAPGGTFVHVAAQYAAPRTAEATLAVPTRAPASVVNEVPVRVVGCFFHCAFAASGRAAARQIVWREIVDKAMAACANRAAPCATPRLLRDVICKLGGDSAARRSVAPSKQLKHAARVLMALDSVVACASRAGVPADGALSVDAAVEILDASFVESLDLRAANACDRARSLVPESARESGGEQRARVDVGSAERCPPATVAPDDGARAVYGAPSETARRQSTTSGVAEGGRASAVPTRKVSVIAAHAAAATRSSDETSIAAVAVSTRKVSVIAAPAAAAMQATSETESVGAGALGIVLEDDERNGLADDTRTEFQASWCGASRRDARRTLLMSLYWLTAGALETSQHPTAGRLAEGGQPLFGAFADAIGVVATAPRRAVGGAVDVIAAARVLCAGWCAVLSGHMCFFTVTSVWCRWRAEGSGQHGGHATRITR